MKILVFYLWLQFCWNCFAKLNTEWWTHTIIYEMIPCTFKDSDGDGTGDFKGITSKLDHFVDLGIETIHMTPMFETTARDMGYDITDYYKVDHGLGTMSDLEELISEMNKRNMKLLLDLVINHSGHKHEWFQKSIDRIDPYTDFYVWKDSKGFNNKTNKKIPPNRWVSKSVSFGSSGSGWEWNEKRKQFYFHQFLAEQPDFDLRNEIVKKELWKIIEFWLNKGVAGFRLDATPFFFEDKEFRDDDHSRQFNQPEVYEFIHEFRTYLDKYNQEHGGFERIFIAEAHSKAETVIKYYDREDYPITHFPYTFLLSYLGGPLKANRLIYCLSYWMTILPKGKVSAWMTQDHDGSRVGSRIVPEYGDIFTMISMMLPGTVGVYYGQEIAMIDGLVTKEQIKDFSGGGSRDPARLTMQWDDSINAGFSTNTTTTYLPANSDYFERNVEMQKIQPVSHYNLFKDLSTLRRTNTFRYGKFKNNVHFENIYILTRSYEGHVLTLIANLYRTSSFGVNLTEILRNHPDEIIIAAASVNSGYIKGSNIEHDSWEEFYMRPLASVVLESYQPHTENEESTSSPDF
ncbi:maltase 1-like [Planococcus citri]|uniref:maltase 1-like n=1 Tax=Planococcus citri TaxID=170843 RepID=UPI0031F80F8C